MVNNEKPRIVRVPVVETVIVLPAPVEDGEGNFATLAVETKQVMKDENGDQFVVQRVVENLFGKDKAMLLAALNRTMNKLKFDNAAAEALVQAKIDEIALLP